MADNASDTPDIASSTPIATGTPDIASSTPVATDTSSLPHEIASGTIAVTHDRPEMIHDVNQHTPEEILDRQ